MAWTVEASGTQSASVGTEHSLHTNSGANTFVFIVDTVNMVAGDVLELRVYLMALSGGTRRVAYLATYAHDQSEPIKISLPVPSPGQTNGFEATLK